MQNFEAPGLMRSFNIPAAFSVLLATVALVGLNMTD
jgi:hypothetical protein